MSFSTALISSIMFAMGAILFSSTTASACKEFQLRPAFSIRQSNGFAVTIRVAADRGDDISGSANYGYPPKVGQILKGSFDGRILNFVINWSGGGSGRYEGSINRKGKFIGVTRGGGGTARFESIQRFECVG